MRWSTLIRLLLAAALLLAAGLFTVQNFSRTTPLTFDVYVVAWQLARPVPVPLVAWAGVLVGASFAWITGWRARRRLAQRLARAEQDALLRAAGRPRSDAPSGPPSAEPPTADDWGR